jgi:hypothetical protein
MMKCGEAVGSMKMQVIEAVEMEVNRGTEAGTEATETQMEVIELIEKETVAIEATESMISRLFG